MPPDFLSNLRAIYPDSRLLSQTAQLLPYESDALTAYHALGLPLPERGRPHPIRGQESHHDGGQAQDADEGRENRLNAYYRIAEPQIAFRVFT